MRYTFLISHNCGMSYQKALESDSLDDSEFKSMAEYCNQNYLRYVIEDEQGGNVGLSDIHKATLALFGPSSPYKSRSVDEMVSDLTAHFGCKTKKRSGSIAMR
jgi:hypothetical protein